MLVPSGVVSVNGVTWFSGSWSDRRARFIQSFSGQTHWQTPIFAACLDLASRGRHDVHIRSFTDDGQARLDLSNRGSLRNTPSLEIGGRAEAYEGDPESKWCYHGPYGLSKQMRGHWSSSVTISRNLRDSQGKGLRGLTVERAVTPSSAPGQEMKVKKT